LTDDDPPRAVFTYTLSPSFRQSDLFGGSGGGYFNDLPSLPSGAKPSLFQLRGSARLDAVSITLTSGQTFTHGGNGGDASSIQLDSHEHVVKVELCQSSFLLPSSRIFFASFTTDAGRSVSAGKRTGDCVTFNAEAGWQVAGFYGRSGEDTDQLGLLYTRS
jgi:hypothetical protein